VTFCGFIGYRRLTTEEQRLKELIAILDNNFKIAFCLRVSVVSFPQSEFSYCGAVHGSAHQQRADGDGRRQDRAVQNHGQVRLLLIAVRGAKMG